MGGFPVQSTSTINIFSFNILSLPEIPLPRATYQYCLNEPLLQAIQLYGNVVIDQGLCCINQLNSH